MQSVRCTLTVPPRVMKPRTSSPGTGVQQRASLAWTSSTPPTRTPTSAEACAAAAVTAAPTIAYVYPGQGIQAKGMGMEGRTRCPAAREVAGARA